MKTIHANLLDFPLEINKIFQVCNIRKTMGAGLALQAKKRYPEIYQADLDYKPQDEDRFGGFSEALVWCSKKEAYLGDCINLYAQDLGGKNLSDSGVPFRIEYYKEALSLYLNYIAQWDGMYKKCVLGFPWMIGSDLAGGNWEDVKAITEELCKDFESYWVKYEPAMKKS